MGPSGPHLSRYQKLGSFRETVETAAPVVGTCGRVGEGECNMWSIGNVPVTRGNIQVTNVMYRKLNNKVVISHIISKQEIHTNTKREKNIMFHMEIESTAHTI